MDYEQFFVKQDDHKCDNHVRMAVAVVTLLYIILDLTLTCGQQRKVKDLQKENQTLKTVILKSVDRALIRMMKNGNDSDDEHED